MVQENKELLLKGLCARIPYHPKGHIVNACNGSMCDEWLTCATFTLFTNIMNNCRLYLRPMSSMTEEEKKYYKEYFRSIEGQLIGMQGRTIWLIDWLNAHHFDYRDLIKQGLAIEVTEENNPYK